MSPDSYDNGIIFPRMSTISFPEMSRLKSFGGPTRALQAAIHEGLKPAIHKPIHASEHQSIRSASKGRSIDRMG